MTRPNQARRAARCSIDFENNHSSFFSALSSGTAPNCPGSSLVPTAIESPRGYPSQSKHEQQQRLLPFIPSVAHHGRGWISGKLQDATPSLLLVANSFSILFTPSGSRMHCMTIGGNARRSRGSPSAVRIEMRILAASSLPYVIDKPKTGWIWLRSEAGSTHLQVLTTRAIGRNAQPHTHPSEPLFAVRAAHHPHTSASKSAQWRNHRGQARGSHA